MERLAEYCQLSSEHLRNTPIQQALWVQKDLKRGMASASHELICKSVIWNLYNFFSLKKKEREIIFKKKKQPNCLLWVKHSDSNSFSTFIFISFMHQFFQQVIVDGVVYIMIWLQREISMAY